MTITELPSLVEALPPEKKEIFQRLFKVKSFVGCMNYPKAMHPWVQKHFGPLEKVTCQEIVKITNLVTFEGALFNKLRASRPIDVRTRLNLEANILDKSKDNPLANPEELTPEDLFGRIRGKYSITASNIAKYDALHGIVIFDQYNPLAFTKERIIDYIDTGWKWAQEAHKLDPNAKYFFFIWNCLWRAGASLPHGHAQVMLTQDIHYAKIEGLRRAALRYQKEYNSNYFDDLYLAHYFVGCGFKKEGVKILAYLTPVKDKEVMLLSSELSLSLKERIYEVLACFRDKMNVTSFNLSLVTPPLAEVEEDWEGFPVITRIVDRGDPRVTASDIGAMELYAASVISSDPFEVAKILKESLLEKDEDRCNSASL